jgi:hypothetical protein
MIQSANGKRTLRVAPFTSSRGIISFLREGKAVIVGL